jgi:UDPglucose 6-dehydrogenase
MSPVNAEIAKISLNCYLTMKITFANSLAAVCEKVAGADAEVISKAIGSDSRIGRKFLKPGLGFGGPCFPRDNIAFATFARKVNVCAKLAETVDEVNKDQAKRITEMIEEAAKKEKRKVKIGILGLSYKPDSPVIEDSQAIDITDNLTNKGYDIIVYDPQALQLVRDVFGNKVEYASTALKCFEKSDILVIATPWNEFEEIDFNCTNHRPRIIIDCWRIIKDKSLKVKYVGVGEC